MNAARDELIAAVRQAIGDGAPESPIPRHYLRGGRLEPADRVALFVQRVSDYRASVESASAADVRSAVERHTHGHRIAVPDGLRDEWRPRQAVVDDGFKPDQLANFGGVVTGCTLAIAETGTVILSGGPGEGRRALTLVPDLHVCIVAAEQVVETVPEALARLRGLESRPLTFVSGPSATSDIELERVEGVHGPRTLVIVIAS